MTSQVWICSTKQNTSHVTVVDANNPGHVIAAFPVSASHVLCMTSVPGCAEDDFEWNESQLHPPIVTKPEDTDNVTSDVSAEASGGEESQLSSIATVECATGTSPIAPTMHPPEPGL